MNSTQKEINENQQKQIFKLGVLISLIVFIAFVFIYVFNKTAITLSTMITVVGIVSFYGFIGLGVSEKEDKLSKTDLRLAITLSTLTIYFILIGVTTFYKTTGELPAYASTLITHFTTIVGVIIAFYFSTEAYIAVNKSNDQKNNQ